jgi:gluconokinase
MNPKLLDSQFATLEPPKEALRIENDSAPAEVVDQILEHVSLTAGQQEQEKQQGKT